MEAKEFFSWVLSLSKSLLFLFTDMQRQKSQKEKFSSPSPNPVGSGARALGMGGAFIAVCDDATAASWNPAGLVQLEKPEMSIVYDYHNNRTDNDYKAFSDASSSQSASSSDLNYLSAAYPFVLWKRNMTASINYQHLYDFDDKQHGLIWIHNDLSLAVTTFFNRDKSKLHPRWAVVDNFACPGRSGHSLLCLLVLH